MFLVLLSTLAVIMPPLTRMQTVEPPAVFEVELPDFHIHPSSQPEITVPSASVSQILIHILKPAADNIDYGNIKASLNAQAAAPISEVLAGARGKIIRMELNRFPGYEFVTGRNTVEVWAQNRRGRTFYSSFVIKTANEHWNTDFTYEVQLGPGSKIPPKVVLLEPQQYIELPSTKKSMAVRISGIAASSTGITRVSVDGKPVQFAAGREFAARQLTRLTNTEQPVSFATTRSVDVGTTQLVVEAEDKTGSRTRVLIPILVNDDVTTRVSGKKYALIIGISKYKYNLRGIQDLEFADVDARAVYELLQQPSAGGFSRENMLLLSNEQATVGRIREALTNFISKPTANDLLLIFFAGHGSPDPFVRDNLYIIAHDTNIEDMADTAIAMQMLRGYLDRNVRSKRLVLFMDACHSAGLATGTRNVGNNLANLYLEKLLYQEEGRAIITSSDVNEVSRESKKWGNGHGVFTYHLLEGLKGYADSNRDRFVSVGELFRYVRQKVRVDTDFQQNPRMLAGSNEDVALSVALSH